MDIFDFVECSNQTRSPERLFGLLVDAAGSEGFDQVAYGTLTYRAPLQPTGCVPPAVVLNYPVGWQQRYFERRYQVIDPVVTCTPRMARPFLWDSLAERGTLDRAQRLVLDEAREAGLRNGVSVPLHGPCGKVAVMSFASRCDDGDPTANLSRLTALASQFHVAFSELAHAAEREADNVQLSQRERDCLSWTAQGKSSWDIGVILMISENTVNFHVKNAMRKLETSSRTVAVIKALRRGLIDLPYV
ncbi:MAG: LuxR family transcriptional regulator [Pseudonocardiales bacterium]|nr:LuxR family transcriptional regulator [Hyphomicrobiales bacterium]MBV8825532.1 LuxR family transcriptional regulator [Hyphomicrobiales bacterium]MBV9429458.1 LuxR family transcriptional regulator [Bradyrhizobiaceae bacterium]MBV9728126.1 LuxR family transcriptional regulator [Pseudonocardiales bacterium]